MWACGNQNSMYLNFACDISTSVVPTKYPNAWHGLAQFQARNMTGFLQHLAEYNSIRITESGLVGLLGLQERPCGPSVCCRKSVHSVHTSFCTAHSHLDFCEDEVQVGGGQLLSDKFAVLARRRRACDSQQSMKAKGLPKKKCVSKNTTAVSRPSCSALCASYKPFFRAV